MKERQVEVDDMEDEDASDSESTKSLKMEMVEVIKLHMSVEMPEGKIFSLTLLLHHLRDDHTLHEIQYEVHLLRLGGVLSIIWKSVVKFL